MNRRKVSGRMRRRQRRVKGRKAKVEEFRGKKYMQEEENMSKRWG